MQPVAFEHIDKPLLFVHLIAGITCVAASVHLLLRAMRAYQHPGRYTGQTRLHAVILAGAYLSSVVLGGLIYPTFRIHVRYLLFDPAIPWATGLFEIKELLATVGVIPILGIVAFSRHLDARVPEHRPFFPMYLGLIGFTLLVVLFNACCGWYLGTIRSL
ncbi:MAG: hypothetical protein AMXMBFR82_24830 [Candidatus Hydrogenedentota bacterium]